MVTTIKIKDNPFGFIPTEVKITTSPTNHIKVQIDPFFHSENYVGILPEPMVISPPENTDPTSICPPNGIWVLAPNITHFGNYTSHEVESSLPAFSPRTCPNAAGPHHLTHTVAPCDPSTSQPNRIPSSPARVAPPITSLDLILKSPSTSSTQYPPTSCLPQPNLLSPILSSIAQPFTNYPSSLPRSSIIAPISITFSPHTSPHPTLIFRLYPSPTLVFSSRAQNLLLTL